MQSAVQAGGLIDGVSSLLDTVVEKVQQTGIIDYNKTKKVFALGGINIENLGKIKDHFYGFAGIRIINDIIKSNF